MSANQQVFWLRGLPTSFALPQNAVAYEAFVARYSGATARDLHPLPYSPQIVIWGTDRIQNTTNCVFVQRTVNRLYQNLNCRQSLFEKPTSPHGNSSGNWSGGIGFGLTLTLPLKAISMITASLSP
jgi:hypothetical protein